MKRPKTFSGTLIALCAIAFSIFATAYSAPYFSEVLPNTDDDASFEYFSLRNPSCQNVAFSGYLVVDASGKAFQIPSNVEIAAFSNVSFLRPETKITLNNENETLSLFNPFGILVDSFTYASSSKNVPLRRSGFSDDLCPVPEPESPAEPTEMPEEEPGMKDSEVLEDYSAGAGLADQSLTDGPSVVGSETWSGAESPDHPEPEWITDVSGIAAGVSWSWGAFSWSGTISESWATTQSGGAAGYGTWTLIWTASTVTGTAVSSGTSGTPQNPSQTPVFPSYATPVSYSASSSGIFPASTARATAETLTLHDSNLDGRFDSVEIRYSEAVFWTPDPSEFLLYSKTGGLYEHRVSSTWGYFSSATVVGSVLRLTFSWTTLQKTAFRVDSSTSSDFRIKTSSSTPSLKTASSGLPVMPLGLTTSFSWYSAEKVFLVPGFDEADSMENETDAARDWAEQENDAVAGSSTWAVSSTWSDTAKVPTIPLSDIEKPAVQKVGSQPVQKSAAKVPVPAGLSLVPSSWVDLLPNGKYLLICFSKTCSPSFKVEGLPLKTKGYWLFSDGRKRYGASTSTLGKTVPANYRLAYVVETSQGVAKIPVELSVVPESHAETVKWKAETVTKEVASSVSKTPQSKPATPKTASSSVKSSTGKTSSWSASSKVRNEGDENGWQPYRTVSAAVASAFLGLAGWAGWFAYRRRSWLPEETP